MNFTVSHATFERAKSWKLTKKNRKNPRFHDALTCIYTFTRRYNLRCVYIYFFLRKFFRFLFVREWNFAPYVRYPHRDRLANHCRRPSPCLDFLGEDLEGRCRPLMLTLLAFGVQASFDCSILSFVSTVIVSVDCWVILNFRILTVLGVVYNYFV